MEKCVLSLLNITCPAAICKREPFTALKTWSIEAVGNFNMGKKMKKGAPHPRSKPWSSMRKQWGNMDAAKWYSNVFPQLMVNWRNEWFRPLLVSNIFPTSSLSTASRSICKEMSAFDSRSATQKREAKQRNQSPNMPNSNNQMLLLLECATRAWDNSIV